MRVCLHRQLGANNATLSSSSFTFWCTALQETLIVLQLLSKTLVWVGHGTAFDYKGQRVVKRHGVALHEVRNDH